MATFSVRRPLLLSNVVDKIRMLPEGTNQTFKANTFVKLSSGSVVVCAYTSPTNNDVVADVPAVYGWCLDDASKTAGTLLRVVEFTGNEELEFTLTDTTGAATSVTEPRGMFGLFVCDTTTGTWTVSLNTTEAITNRGLVLRPAHASENGDVGQRLLLKFRLNIDGGTAANSLTGVQGG